LCSNGKCTLSLGAGQDGIYTVPERVNYILAKGYNCITQIYFMLKTMQKLVASNIRDETLGCSLHLYQTAYIPGKSTETAMHHMNTHIQEAVENRNLQLRFPKY
jgi:hypothetical protein